MNERAVFGVLLAVAGFITVVENLSKDMEIQRGSKSKLWAHNDEQDSRLKDHETRIRILEETE